MRDNQGVEETGRNGTPKQTGMRLRYRMNQVAKAATATRNRTSRTSPQHGNGPQGGGHLSQIKPSPTQNHLLQRRRSSSAAQTLRKRVFGLVAKRREEVERGLQDLVKERTYRDKKERARLQAKEALLSRLKSTSDIGMPKNLSEDLKKHAQEAWEKKITSFTALSTKLDSLAEQAWQDISEKSGDSVPDEAAKTTWKQLFIATWEKAWKESWVEAWQAVWDDAWDAAIARGAEFGVEEVFDKDPNLKRTNYENLKSKKAYIDVQKLINEGDYLSCLEQVRLMARELYRLYESLQHSIPVFRDEGLKITGFETNSVPKARAKRFRPKRYAYIEERTPTHLSYYELQEWVDKRYIGQKFADNENGKKLFKRSIAQVWGTALNVYNASTRDTTPAKARATEQQTPAAVKT
ncbi:hypothetical protein FRC11_006905 [Ceratobasidium sp. 423]|nr:hypothetical protein FRC11_006905 [Ceratobasidium sp. 423]